MSYLSDFGARIKKKRTAIGMSQDKLAQKAGYTSRSSINKIEQGLVDIPQSKIAAIADALGTTPAYLMGWTQEEEKPRAGSLEKFPNIHPIGTQRLPLLGEIACGEPIFCNEERESYVQCGAEIKADFCLICKGDSMIGAGIHDGDIVFVRKQSAVDNGQIGVVVIGDEATLKRVYYNAEKAKLVLQAENPQFEPLVYTNEELDEIHILGLAVAYQSDVK